MDFYPKLVLDIKGMFFVPAYQRGYRWGKAEVTRLLDDIYERVNTGQNYCLQRSEEHTSELQSQR